MRKTIYTLAATAAMLVLVLSMPFTATVSANYSLDPTPEPTLPGSSPTPVEETPPPDAPVSTEDPLPLEQQSLPKESQAVVAAAASPTIVVWGETEGELYFGQLGNPQPSININGNVSDPDNDITGLTYRLDGGSSTSAPFNPSSSSPRLVRRGDFTIEIDTAGLSEGWHEVRITATHSSGNSVTKPVSFHYTSGRAWALAYSTNWNSATFINQRAQVVDGYWRFDTSAGYKGVRPRNGFTGYDRIIAIGDMNWSNYEVSVPITVWSTPNGEGGVGIISNWKGHQGSGLLPDDWSVMGAYGYYSFRSDTNRLAMWLNNFTSDRRRADTTAFQMQIGKTYIFKLRSERINGGGRYSLKAWEYGTPEPPYDAPQFSGVFNVVDTRDDQTEGSILLNAHLVDATFGDVTVTPLNGNVVPQNNKHFIAVIRR